MNSFTSLTQQYGLSKTMRFELRPIGQTLQYVEKHGFLKADERKALEYQKLKKWIDEYHRDFIDGLLAGFSFDASLLEASYQIQCDIERIQQKISQAKKDKKNAEVEKLDEQLKTLVKKQEEEHKQLRTKLGKAFRDADKFANLFKKGLIEASKTGPSDLEKWALQQPQDDKIQELINVTLPYFKKFTSYFHGFHENRQNMYTDKDQNTAIPYRVVDVNWPKFRQNVETWNKNQLSNEAVQQIEKDFPEELRGRKLEDFFSLAYFNHCLRQDGIDDYNTVLGGKVIEGQQEKIQGINEYYNLAWQQSRAQGKTKAKRIRLTPLYKQILGKKGSRSFVLPAFDNDGQMLEAIADYHEQVIISPDENVLSNIGEFVQEFPTEDLENIYLRNDSSLTKISAALFGGDWGFITRTVALYNDLQFQQSTAGQAKPSKKQQNELEKKAKAPYLSIADIEEALLCWKNQQEDPKKFKQIDGQCISRYFRNFQPAQQRTGAVGGTVEGNFVDRIHQKYTNLKVYIEEAQSGEIPDNFVLQNKDRVASVKDYLDSVMDLLHFLKPLSLSQNDKNEKADKANQEFLANGPFYQNFAHLYHKLDKIVPIYNKVRNRVTKKAYSQEKFKLTFDNGTLLNGWDKNKELDNTCTLFLKDGSYYLGIINPDHKKIWETLPQAVDGEACYQKMRYKLVPGPNKMLPKVFLSGKGKQIYCPPAQLLENYQNESHKKNSSNFNLKDCHALIDYFKESLKVHPEWGIFQFQFSDTAAYRDLSDFYQEFEKQSYRMDFDNLPCSAVDQWVSEGKLYLFEIYNKDFSPKTKGTPNLSTLYWKMLFAPENLQLIDESGFQHPLFKLNGEAELFYRKHSLEPKIEHPKGQKLKNKRHQASKQKTFGYDIIKDRRYKQDKFFFHVPITINYAVDTKVQLNHQVRKLLAQDSSINIIGIDRGEKNLAYYTVLNQQGKLLAQGTLNQMETHLPDSEIVDYHALLDEREKERDQQQLNWLGQSQIKDLKVGYISQVVHKICTLIRDYNAIVILEDLNFGFKRGRFKIEKQIYQNLEKALIQKLNYLVFKDLRDSPQQVASVLNGLQLCPEFESFRKLGKQSGILFYVPAEYTSKIDPLTGFANLFTSQYLSYSNMENAKKFIGQLREIVFDRDEQCLRFDFCYSDFANIRVTDGKIWQVYAKGLRLIYQPKDKKMNEIFLEALSKKIFSGIGIDYQKAGALKARILEQMEVGFWKDLLFLLRATLQLRNSCRDQEDLKLQDYIISPVKSPSGKFFDSRKQDSNLPQDSDANGAYHIALKGLQYIGKIQNASDTSTVNLAATTQEWFDFAQGKPYLAKDNQKKFNETKTRK